MTILILGGDGMLGHKMVQTLRSSFTDVVCTIRGSRNQERYSKVALFRSGSVIENLDALNLEALESLIVKLQPKTVVNCIGIIKQRDAANVAIPSITINSLLPHRVAAAIEPWGGRLFHFSTDCVFSGRQGNYLENSVSDAEDLYGKTKYLGEVSTPNALTLRTSIIGRELRNYRSLLEWFLSQRGKTVRGYTKSMYSGVTTNYLSELVATLIASHPNLTGLYQVASSPISKYDLLCLLRDAFELDTEITPVDGEVSDRTMNGKKFESVTGYVTPDWRSLTAQLAADKTPYGLWQS